MARTCRVQRIEIGSDRPLAILAGPCVLETPALALEIGARLRDACDALGLPYIFKGSFDKANRASLDSPRGPGMRDGLAILEQARQTLGVPVTTDVHHPEQADVVARAADLIQIPAFLCRQTDLIVAAARAAADNEGALNIKKGQFLAPVEMLGPIEKAQAAGCDQLLITERGTFFGYHRLVNDFVGLGDLLELDAPGGPPPVCFDCTHSTQRPGAGSVSGGQPARAPLLARAAVAAGAQAIFLECHPHPERAPSDAASMLTLEAALALLPELAAIRSALSAKRDDHGAASARHAGRSLAPTQP